MSHWPAPTNTDAGFRDLRTLNKCHYSETGALFLDICYKEGLNTDVPISRISTDHYNPEHNFILWFHSSLSFTALTPPKSITLMYLWAEMDSSWPPKKVKDPAQMLTPVHYKCDETLPSIVIRKYKWYRYKDSSAREGSSNLFPISFFIAWGHVLWTYQRKTTTIITSPHWISTECGQDYILCLNLLLGVSFENPHTPGQAMACIDHLWQVVCSFEDQEQLTGQEI